MNILIVERNKLVRNGLIRMIERVADWNVCGNALPDGQCDEAPAGQTVDVVVFSMGIPTSSCLKNLLVLRTRFTEAKIVALSIQNDNQLMKRVLSEGVSAIVNLDTAEEELIEAIHAAITGDTYISSQIDAQGELNR